MTLEELLAQGKLLRAQLEDYMRTQQATTGTGAPAPGTQGPASGLDSDAIFRKPTGTWTQAEKDHVRGEVNSVLRDMGR